MVYNYRTKGVCSKEMHIELNDDHTIKSVEVIGGCNGNLQGISRLVEGMKAEDAIARIRGIRCGFKDTSCPDQLSIALTERSRRCSNCIFPCTAYILSLKMNQWLQNRPSAHWTNRRDSCIISKIHLIKGTAAPSD